jgi:hypothetical protein
LIAIGTQVAILAAEWPERLREYGNEYAMRPRNKPTAEADRKRANHRTTKKDQVVSLFLAGIDKVEDLAMITRSRPSYVASVLQDSGLISGYFDLYTTTAHPMNVYSKFFASRLGFRDLETSHESVAVLDKLYQSFDRAGDRAGQHHALVMALVMFDRARWTDKLDEADVFRRWILDRLNDVESPQTRGEPGDWVSD